MASLDIANSDSDIEDPGKLWTTCSFRCTVSEKDALEVLARKLITTRSRLIRFAANTLLLRQQHQLQDILKACIYGRNV